MHLSGRPLRTAQKAVEEARNSGNSSKVAEALLALAAARSLSIAGSGCGNSESMPMKFRCTSAASNLLVKQGSHQTCHKSKD